MEYMPVWKAMQKFTDQRDAETKDEIWLLEHPDVFTQGLAGKEEHIHEPGAIPVIQIDRGGQVTYHSTGQLICYVLLNLRRLELTIKQLINLLEQSIINLLYHYGIESERKINAPGIYVSQAKIASLGLRVRKGCTYHGLAFNVRMDLAPFSYIDPCGFPGMSVTQLSDLGIKRSIPEVSHDLIRILCTLLNYNADKIIYKTSLPNYENQA